MQITGILRGVLRDHDTDHVVAQVKCRKIDDSLIKREVNLFCQILVRREDCLKVAEMCTNSIND